MGRCLKSIFASGAEKNANVEVIVVNDGTPDNSMTIVDDFASKHSNLFIINQENAGLGEARNAGLRIARGKYVWFVDSDDYVSQTAVSDLVQLAEQSNIEVYVFDTWRGYENGSHMTSRRPLFIFKSNERCYGQIHDGYFYYKKIGCGTVWDKLFLRSFLLENDLFFIPGILHEDIEYVTRIFVCAKRVLPLKAMYYYYVVRISGSITTTFNIKRFDDQLYTIKLCVQRGNESDNWRIRALYNDAACRRSYRMLHPREAIRTEHAEFLSKHKAELRRIIIRSYFHSIRINDWRKTSYMLLTFLGISDGIDKVWCFLKDRIQK